VVIGSDVGSLVVGELRMRHLFLLPVRVLVPPSRAERGQPDEKLRLGTVAGRRRIVTSGGRSQQDALFAGHGRLFGLPVLDHRPVLQRVDQPLFLFGHLVHKVTGVLLRLDRCRFATVPKRPRGTVHALIIVCVRRRHIVPHRRRLAAIPLGGTTSADVLLASGGLLLLQLLLLWQQVLRDGTGGRGSLLFKLLQRVLNGRCKRLGRQRTRLSGRLQPGLVLHHELVHQPFQVVGAVRVGHQLRATVMVGRGRHVCRQFGLRSQRRAELVGCGRRVTVARQYLVGRQAPGLPCLVYRLRVVRYLFGDGRYVFLWFGSHVTSCGGPVVCCRGHRSPNPAVYRSANDDDDCSDGHAILRRSARPSGRVGHYTATAAVTTMGLNGDDGAPS